MIETELLYTSRSYRHINRRFKPVPLPGVRVYGCARLLGREQEFAPGAGEESDGSTKDGNAADNSGVLGRRQGLVGRGNEALGGTPRGSLIAVNSLRRHCNGLCWQRCGCGDASVGVCRRGEILKDEQIESC
jgi:hypothetical protein